MNFWIFLAESKIEIVKDRYEEVISMSFFNLSDAIQNWIFLASDLEIEIDLINLLSSETEKLRISPAIVFSCVHYITSGLTVLELEI